MPVVWIQRDPNLIEDLDMIKIGKQLMVMVAYHLNIPDNPDGGLNPSDIIIRPQDIHPLAINNQPLEVIIFAHDFPERRKGIDERAEIIAEEIRPFLPDDVQKLLTKGFVWIYLGYTGFSRIT